jgi:flagellar basal-body rod modification protein FlgD
MTISGLVPTTTPNKTALAVSTTPSSTAATASNMLTGADFMTLLVAQLKAQDPTAPMDPTTFVNQLVGFNSLQQLININGDLTPPATGTGSTPVTGTTPTSPTTPTPTANNLSTAL